MTKIRKAFREAIEGAGIIGGGTFLHVGQCVRSGKYVVTMQDSGGTLQDVRLIERYEDRVKAEERFAAIAQQGFTVYV